MYMNLLEQLSKKAFWDVDMKKMDAEKHANYIIEKVFERGSLQDIRTVLRFYSREKISSALLDAVFLFPDTLQFASSLLQIPKDKFTCYTNTLSRKIAGMSFKS